MSLLENDCVSLTASASDIELIGERFHRVESVSRSHEGTGIGLALIKELIKLHGGIMEIESVTAAESMGAARQGLTLVNMYMLNSQSTDGSTFRVRIP